MSTQSEADYQALRAIVQASGRTDREVEQWLRADLAAAPEWLRRLVLHNFGYHLDRPGLPPRGRQHLVRRS